MFSSTVCVCEPEDGGSGRVLFFGVRSFHIWVYHGVLKGAVLGNEILLLWARALCRRIDYMLSLDA